MADVVFFGGRMSERLEAHVEALAQGLPTWDALSYEDLVAQLLGTTVQVEPWRPAQREEDRWYDPDPDEWYEDDVVIEVNGFKPIHLELSVTLVWEVVFESKDIVFMPLFKVTGPHGEGIAYLDRDAAAPLERMRGIETRRFQLPEEVETLPLPEWAQVDWDWGQEDLPPRIISLTCFKSEAMALKAEFIAQLGPTEREDKS